MDAYREMIQRFTQRRLTFAEDSIFALAGVTPKLGSGIPPLKMSEPREMDMHKILTLRRQDLR
jgi:hypothetical protein